MGHYIFLQLFVAGNYIGDGETVMEMNERGELKELLQDYKVCTIIISIQSEWVCHHYS
jgi:hypothetical protein